MKLLKAQPGQSHDDRAAAAGVGQAEGRIVAHTGNVELEFRVEDGDIDAFLDHHSQHSAARREIRRRQMYGYVILFAIFGLMFWFFGETAVAIAFLVLGPIWVAWWPTRARRLARKQAADVLPAAPEPVSRRPARPPAGRCGSFPCRAAAPKRARPTPASSASCARPTTYWSTPARCQAIVIPRPRVATGDVDIFVQQLRARMRRTTLIFRPFGPDSWCIVPLSRGAAFRPRPFRHRLIPRFVSTEAP